MQGARGGGTHAVVRGYAPIWNRGERVSVSSEFGRRAADDELCAAVAKAVADGDSDALRRLGLDGWGEYVQRLSELMNESVRDELDYSPDFGALMSQVASPARYAHHLVTESGTAIQSAKDTPLGIHIKPLEPEFDDDALKGTVGTAANAESPEQAVETLADGLAYAVKKAGNEFIEKNAEQRSRAGFEVGVKRSGSAKCCPWCAARIGSWSLKNAPDGVFGCHANCSCVVEYTSSTGAVSQRRGTGRFVEVEYQPPHVMTHEEAREKGGFDEPKRLTGGGNGGIIGSNNSRNGSNKQLLLEAENPYKNLQTPLTVDSEAQSKHFKGGKRYNDYMRTHKYEPSMLTISEEKVQELVNKYHGTGILKLNSSGKVIESEIIIDNDEIIGYASNNQNGITQPTTAFKIHYSKDGTHIVPTYESQKKYWSEKRNENGYDWLLRQKS